MNKRHCQHPICFPWGDKDISNNFRHLQVHTKKSSKRVLIRQFNVICENDKNEVEIYINCDILQQTFHIGVTLSDKVGSVKDKIEALDGISSVLQLLFFNSMGLGNKDTLAGCGVQNKSILTLVIKLHTAVCKKCESKTNKFSPKLSKIFLDTLTGERYDVMLPLSNPVDDLKHLVEEKYNVYPDRQLITYNGTKLEDDVSLIEYGITDDAVLLLILYEFDTCSFCAGCAVANGRPTVTIEFLSYCVTWALYPESTLKNFKQTTYSYLNHIHPDLQQIVYQNQELNEDEKSLQSCGIKDGAVLSIKLNLTKKRCDECHQLICKK